MSFKKGGDIPLSSNAKRAAELATNYAVSKIGSNENELLLRDKAELAARSLPAAAEVGTKVGYKLAKDKFNEEFPEGLSRESFMSKFVRPIIEVIIKYIMENYLTEENITTVSNLMQSIVEEFFERLDDIADKNPQLAIYVSKLKAMVAKAISKQARRTVVPEGDEVMPQAGGKRRTHTKKRKASKRRY